ncbi:MAG: ribose-5-phosphate isomerase RpiA [Lactobacillaceae bacterium]|jgi:ribose 5-phosphate isomerase A|nr:ribose-5-phosphate isomerase RpiA [Lactobacillaceae bacterium]
MNALQQKQQVGEYVAQLVPNHCVVGLGTGSTVRFFVEALGRRVQTEGLQITGVTTSNKTAKLATELGIPLADVDAVDYIELTIDGADRVDQQLRGIKGGGAALLYEKIVAANSRKNIWIVDESKVCDTLGGFPLPVEVIAYGAEHLMQLFAEEGLYPSLRTTSEGTPLITDNGNQIIDLHLDVIEEPENLAAWLANQVGVVEHGIFLDLCDEVIVGGNEIRVLKKLQLV